jgi:hypothetical protein
MLWHVRNEKWRKCAYSVPVRPAVLVVNLQNPLSLITFDAGKVG